MHEISCQFTAFPCSLAMSWTYTVRFLMLKLILLRSSEKRIMDECNMSISSSVHLLRRASAQRTNMKTMHNYLNMSSNRVQIHHTLRENTYPDGDSAFGCNCIVKSPSLLNACPAAVNISPTCTQMSVKRDYCVNCTGSCCCFPFACVANSKQTRPFPPIKQTNNFCYHSPPQE